MVHSLLADVGRVRRGEDGLPYIVLENALPHDYYAQLEASWPATDVIAGGDELKNNTAYRIAAQQVATNTAIAEVWRAFVAYHSSADFLAEVHALWREQIADLHRFWPQNFGKGLEDFTVGQRSPGKHANDENAQHDIVMDCQFVINSPVTEVSSVRGPHLDSPHKLFAGLFYMRDPQDDSSGGDLEFYRLKGSKWPKPKPSRIDWDRVELAERVPYKPNTLVMFLNSPLSVHGVTPRSTTQRVRRYMNLLGECYRGRHSDFFITPAPELPYWARTLRARVNRYV